MITNKHSDILRTIRCPKCGEDDDIPYEDNPNNYKCFYCGTPMQWLTVDSLPESWQFRW